MFILHFIGFKLLSILIAFEITYKKKKRLNLYCILTNI